MMGFSEGKKIPKCLRGCVTYDTMNMNHLDDSFLSFVSDIRQSDDVMHTLHAILIGLYTKGVA